MHVIRIAPRLVFVEAIHLVTLNATLGKNFPQPLSRIFLQESMQSFTGFQKKDLISWGPTALTLIQLKYSKNTLVEAIKFLVLRP